MSHVLAWYRYIDDVFLIWDGPDDLLHKFIDFININEFNLSFTMSHSTTEITFLDVLVKKQPDGSLSSQLFRKPTAGNSLLHATSFHPKPLLASITYSQYLRVRWNCSDDITFKKEADMLRKRLLERGYSSPCLKKAYRKTIKLSHHDLLNVQKQPSTDDKTRSITRYSTQHKQLKWILNKYWYLLPMDSSLSPFVSTCCYI